MKQMNGGKQSERGQELMRAVGMAGKVGSRHTARRTGTAGGHSQRILRPAQASQPTNGPQLAGFAAKTTAAANDVGLSLAVQVRGGSTVVLAAIKAGSDIPNLSLPHLSPLPVTVPTHSLNLKNPI